MKFKVYDTLRKRYLTSDELSDCFFFNNTLGHDVEGEWENTTDFRVNLLTGKIQIEFDIAICTDSSCCGGPQLIWTDADNFIIELEND